MKAVDLSKKERVRQASRAAGHIRPHVSQSARDDLLLVDGTLWCPLDDDGDALRLAVKLRITIEQCLIEKKVSAYVVNGKHKAHFVSMSGNIDINEATRLAIVTVAADIGLAIPEGMCLTYIKIS